MRALRSFTVRVRVPPDLSPLQELANNLRWSWDERTRDLFRWVDPDAWTQSGGDPIHVLGSVSSERLEQLAMDQAFLAFMGEVHAELDRYLNGPAWFRGRPESELKAVAYFSPEFGISEALPQYSGGLGVLAGDHLKAASGLGVPLVGVGLFYREGYFRQRLSRDGWQQERYPALDPHGMPLGGPLQDKIQLDLDGRPLWAQIWRADVGRVHLYLMDTDVEENGPEERPVTDRLYGGNTEHRLRQEILLGVGGVLALQAAGEATQIFHTNEGHAGFLGLERIRQLVRDEQLRFDEALEIVRSGTVFTTHTPVPAGIDQFPAELMAKYFARWADECGIPMQRLMALGHHPGEAADEPFNMAVMGLRLSGRANGVSRLHGETSRRMFAPLWPDLEPDEVPISSVTNGVHAPTWVSPEMADLLSRSVLPNWSEADADDWARIDQVPDDQLWRVREQGRERLVALVRTRLDTSVSGGVGEPDALHPEDVLDPTVLTIGFARRFAGYKRATLLLSDPDRLRALLLSPTRPVQMVFAGKAHPADDQGKEMIRQIVEFSREPDVRRRIAFVEDYDIAVARAFYQGCDVWLNTPVRPMEASGTSGEKALLNGALNCSILDGWWAEYFNGENGWAIPSAESEPDREKRDRAESAGLFDVLERHVVPLFYDRRGGGQHAWLQRVRASLRTLGAEVQASRMVREYVTDFYEPAAHHAVELSSANWIRGRALATWKAGVRAAWDDIRVLSVESKGDTDTQLGSRRWVETEIELGMLGPDDVEVQLIHGPVSANEELHPVGKVEMGPLPRTGRSTKRRFSGGFNCALPGRYGFTVRVLPANADLANPLEMGIAHWG